ncbi:MAG: ABC transporter permease subunit [Planctomycetaceae bacterium]|nr:ABC transporter permease subunit [Planctomycetaceae bacterium]
MWIIEQLQAIARNTFLESIRQPVMLVVAVAATLMIVMCNPFAAYTMQDDQRMFVDIGLSTVFLSTAILASFIATNVLSREIDNRTVLTVVSKPVPRPVFIVGKFLGVSGAMLVALLAFALVFMLVEMHGTLETVRDPFHMPVIVFGIGALLAAAGIGAWMNYFYGKSFAAWCLSLAVPFLGLAYLLALFFDAEWNSVELSRQFQPEIWKAIFLIALATLVLNALAIAASTRLGQVLTLVIVIGVFVLGLLSDWMLGRAIAENTALLERAAAGEATVSSGQRVGMAFFSFCRAALPNFQLFWLSDALTQKKAIPAEYIGYAVPYALALVTALLSLATMLFQRREVG